MQLVQLASASLQLFQLSYHQMTHVHIVIIHWLMVILPRQHPKNKSICTMILSLRFILHRLLIVLKKNSYRGNTGKSLDSAYSGKFSWREPEAEVLVNPWLEVKIYRLIQNTIPKLYS